jgi:hypothetical protein
VVPPDSEPTKKEMPENSSLPVIIVTVPSGTEAVTFGPIAPMLSVLPVPVPLNA